MSAPATPPRARWLLPVAALLVAAVALPRLVGVVSDQLASPYDLMYESPNLASVRVIESGRNPYDPAVYAGRPFVLTMYTPIYHELVAALPDVPGQPFLVGRLVALLGTILCVAVIVAVAGQAVLGLLAAGAFLLVWPVSAYSSYLRSDTLGLALSALCLAALWRPTPRRVQLAALLAVLAPFAKQTFVAAGAAGAIYLLLTDRRLARRYLLAAALFAALAAAAATLVWGRGFWFCTLVAPKNEMSAAVFLALWRRQLSQPMFAVLLAGGLLAAAAAVLRGARRSGAWRASPFLPYFVLSLAVCAATVGKAGSSSIYFLEPTLAAVLWLLASRRAALLDGRLGALLAIALVLAAADEWRTRDHEPSPWRFPATTAKDGKYFASARVGLERLGYEHPSVLNLGPPRYGYGISDDVSLNDQGLYNLLYKEGRLDPAPLIEAVRNGVFDVVLVTSQATPERMAGQPISAVIEAARERYEVLWADGVYTYLGRGR